MRAALVAVAFHPQSPGGRADQARRKLLEMPSPQSIELRLAKGEFERHRLAARCVDLNLRWRGLRRWFFREVPMKVPGEKLGVVLGDGDRQRHLVAGVALFRPAALNRAQLDAEDRLLRQSSELKGGAILPLNGEGISLSRGGDHLHAIPRLRFN